ARGCMDNAAQCHELLPRRFQGFGSASADGNGRASFRERQCDRAPDATASTRDHHALALDVESHHQRPPFTKAIEAWKSSRSCAYSVASSRLTWIHSLELTPPGWKGAMSARENWSSVATG